MLRRFERSARGAVARLPVLLTVFMIGPTEAGGLARSTDGATPEAQCGDAEQGCVRIRGHIPAASELAGVETLGGRPAAFGPPLAPFVAGLDAAGQAAADALSRGLFFLQASHDETAR